MKLIERIKECFSRRVLFITMGALTRTMSGKVYQKHSFDWVFRYGILESIVCYRPKFIYVISNEDCIEEGYVEERHVTKKYNDVSHVVRSYTRAKVDYMFCRSKDTRNTLRMPNTGMLEYFMHSHIDQCHEISDVLFVGENNIAEECAEKVGCRYMYVSDFTEKFSRK